MLTHGKISRRTWLKRMVVVTSAAGAPSFLIAKGNSAELKASQSMVHYQKQPNQGQMCGMCKSFIPASGTMEAGSCKLVEGKISPKAWCILYASK